MNNWGIPEELELEILKRDKSCVYCHVKFEDIRVTKTRKNAGSWEHIINNESIITPENIARCCMGCNSSKGAKTLGDWLNGEYCKEKEINKDTVAQIVKRHIEKYGLCGP